MSPYSARFSVAPMMDWTDRRCRAFHRLLTRRARLYTEMVTADAVVFGPRERLIGFDAAEHPVALQLGGSEPRRLAEAAAIGAGFGYDEINLNCGCPSDRVQSGRFGACLMREPALVGECVAAMAAAVHLPVTVKCRIGVDEQEPAEALFALAAAVKAAGAAALIVHARKALLEGLSPKDNRDRAAARLPAGLCAEGISSRLADGSQRRRRRDLHGGARSSRPCRRGHAWPRHLSNPELLLGVDPAIFGEAAPFRDPFDALEAFMPAIARGLERGERLHDYARHLIGLFAGRPGARTYRRVLASEGVRAGAGLDVLRRAVAHVGRSFEPAAAAAE